MAFEEDFPSLHRKFGNGLYSQNDVKIVMKKDVIEFCLDKQKVKEAFEMIKSSIRTETEIDYNIARGFVRDIELQEKKLGL